jgi:hypothetical protein
VSEIARWKIYLVVAALLGVVGIAIAWAKKRSRLGGFIAGFTLGLGGLALFGMLPDGESRPGPVEGANPAGAPKAWWKTEAAS